MSEESIAMSILRNAAPRAKLRVAASMSQTDILRYMSHKTPKIVIRFWHVYQRHNTRTCHQMKYKGGYRNMFRHFL